MTDQNHAPHTLVTGTDRGIGLGLVRHYLAAGDAVVATSRRAQPGPDLADLLARHPDTLQVMTLDAGDEGSVTRFAREAASRRLTFERVINNAGISQEEAFGAWTDGGFTSHFRVNVVGPALLVQGLASRLARGARVVQITSGRGSAELNQGPADALDAYGVTKCALNMLTRRLAEKLRPEGVVAFAMSPGWVQTDMGGAAATHTVEQAVAAMTATIDAVGMDQAGSFLGPDGSPCPW